MRRPGREGGTGVTRNDRHSPLDVGRAAASPPVTNQADQQPARRRVRPALVRSLARPSVLTLTMARRVYMPRLPVASVVGGNPVGRQSYGRHGI
jgi:hypothetical protein